MTEEQRAELERLAVRLAAHARLSGPDAYKDRMAASNAIKDLLATIARLEAEAVKDGEALELAAGRFECLADDESHAPTRIAMRAWSVDARDRLSSRAKDQSQ